MFRLALYCLAALCLLTLVAPVHAQPPGTDLFGDPLPPFAHARIGTVRWRQGGPVTALVYSPNGKLLASGDHQGNVYLWEADQGRLVAKFPEALTAAVGSLAFSPDGKQLAVCGPHPGVAVIAVATGQRLHTFAAIGDPKVPVVFSHDGKLLAVSTSDGTFLWETQTGKLLHQISEPPLLALVFRLGGKELLGLSRQLKLVAWQVQSGAIASVSQPLKVPLLLGKTAFAPDGRLMAYSAGSKVFLQDTVTGKNLAQWTANTKVVGLTFTPDGKHLAFLEFDRALLSLLDMTAQEMKPREIPLARSADVFSFSPDGKTLAVGGWNSVRRFEVATSKERDAGNGLHFPLRKVLLSSDAKTLVTLTLHTREVAFWDLNNGRKLRTLTGLSEPTQWLALSPNNQLLATASADQTIRLWDAETGVARAVLRGHTKAVDCLAFAPDGATLYSAGDNTLRAWDVAAAKTPSILATFDGPVLGVHPAPVGDLLAVAAMDKRGIVQLHLLDRFSKHKRLVADANPGSNDALVWSPDGRFWALVGSEWQRFTSWVRVYETATTTALWSHEERYVGGANGLLAVAFSPDGRTVFCGYRSEIRCHHTLTGEIRQRLTGHGGVILSMSAVPGGRFLASGSWDGTALLWNLDKVQKATGPERLQLAYKELEACWAELLRPESGLAYVAVARLARDPTAAIAWLRPRLLPVPQEEDKAMRVLLKDLDAGRFAVREHAMTELTRLGHRAVPYLRQQLAGSPPLETRRRMEQLLAKAAPPTPEMVRELRAVAVLEYAGTKEAGQMLQTLADGAPQAELTQAAQAALRR